MMLFTENLVIIVLLLFQIFVGLLVLQLLLCFIRAAISAPGAWLSCSSRCVQTETALL